MLIWYNWYMNKKKISFNWKIFVGVITGVILLVIVSLSIMFGLKNPHSKYWIKISDWNSPKDIHKKGSVDTHSLSKYGGRIIGEWDLNGKIDFNDEGEMDTVYLENSSWDISYYYNSKVDFSEKVEAEQIFISENKNDTSVFMTDAEYSIKTDDFVEEASADFLGAQLHNSLSGVSIIQSGVNVDIKYNGEYGDSLGHVMDGTDFTLVMENDDVVVDSDEFTMDYFRPEWNSHFGSYV